MNNYDLWLNDHFKAARDRSQRAYKVHQKILGGRNWVFQADLQRRKMRVFNLESMKQGAPQPPLSSQRILWNKLYSNIFEENDYLIIIPPSISREIIREKLCSRHLRVSQIFHVLNIYQFILDYDLYIFDTIDFITLTFCMSFFIFQ